IVWSGWDPDAPRANKGLGLTAPVATDNGKPIVKTVREEWVSGTRGGALEAFKLSYEATSTDQSKAMLTVRERVGQADAGAGERVVVRRCEVDQAQGQGPAGLPLRVHLRGEKSQGAGAG